MDETNNGRSNAYALIHLSHIIKLEHVFVELKSIFKSRKDQKSITPVRPVSIDNIHQKLVQVMQASFLARS